MSGILSVLKGLLGLNSRGSGSVAASRMRVMVVHDRCQIPADQLEQMKTELLEVMAKYFNINKEEAECVIESRDNRSAFIITNVPIEKQGNRNASKQVQYRRNRRNLPKSFNGSSL